MASRKLVSLIIVLTITGSLAVAAVVEVGTGVNAAGVYIEWSDGFIAEFEISFGQTGSDTVTGADLMLTLDSELVDFTFEYTDWGSEGNPDLFVDGIGYLGHYNSGFGGGADWWHYWIKDAGQAQWTSPLYGMSSRTVGDGDMDGWIYGRDTAVPEPTTIALLVLGGIMLRRKRA
ncbi:MAG: PEP-CTERM sorting domain-containing protein [Planctomycetota bacterium]|jgi:hypothetical protein